jgi:hypothetical protein
VNWDVNVSNYSQVVTATGGTGGLIYSLFTGDSLPNGLSLNNSTGAITGTPTTNGVFNFRIVAEDTLGVSAVQPYKVTIAGPLSISGQSFSATSSQPFSGLVATANDPSLLTVASNLVATINWGDGYTTNGTVSYAGSGNFNISGSHTYLAGGKFSVTVSLGDVTNPANTATETTAVNVSVHHSAYTALAYSYAYDAYIYSYYAYVQGDGSYATFYAAYYAFYWSYDVAYYFDQIGNQAQSEYGAYYAYYYSYVTSNEAFQDYYAAGQVNNYSYYAYVDAYYASVYSYLVYQGY